MLDLCVQGHSRLIMEALVVNLPAEPPNGWLASTPVGGAACHCTDTAIYRGNVCAGKFLVKSYLRLKPVSVEGT